MRLAPEAQLVDPRPIAGPEAILALKERDDLNVLFVLIDTLRADHLGSYGYQRPTSPVLDLLASQGVRFQHHTAQSSWTKCSMASLWTGLNPARSGVTRFDHVLSSEAVLPAEILREAGFRTAGIWRNGWVEGYFGFDQGFEVYARPPIAAQPDPKLRRENPTVTFGGTDVDAVVMASEFLRIHGRKRWFLYLHLMDVHEYTYDQKSARFGTTYVDVYDNAILFTNSVIDAMLTQLLEQGLLDKTLVVIASDHGEAFGERGREGHARDVYPEVTEVPLILGFPFRLQPGAVVTQPTANVDIWPTLLDLLGLPGLADADGRSRVPEIVAAARRERAPSEQAAPVIAHLDQTWGQRQQQRSPNVSIRDGGFRYIQFLSPQGKLQREHLLDTSDPRELVDRLEDEPEVAEQLRARVATYLEGEPPWGDAPPTLELDELQLNQLRALGYSLP